MPSASSCHPRCRRSFSPVVTWTVSSPSENRMGAGCSGLLLLVVVEAIRTGERVHAHREKLEGCCTL